MLSAHFTRKGWLSVSELTAPSWCEYAYIYMRTGGLPVSGQGEALVAAVEVAQAAERAKDDGKRVHSRLEDAAAPPGKVVQLEAVTNQDQWALRIISTWTGLRWLNLSGTAREVPVFGWTNGVLVTGIIDCLRKRDGIVFLEDTKSRVRKTVPPERDQRGARMQCMLYRRLLDSMATFEWPSSLDLDPSAPLSESFLAHAKPLLVSWGERLTHPITVDSLRALLAKEIPSTSDTLSLVYTHQSTESTISAVSFPHNDAALDTFLSDALQLWHAKRSPRGVELQDTNRCWHCSWRDGCEWRSKQAAAALTRIKYEKDDEEHLWKQIDEWTDADLIIADW